MSREKSELQLFANDWSMIDGIGVRDYIHIIDIAEAHVTALDYLFKNSKSLVEINLDTGVKCSGLQVVNAF